MYLGGNGLYPGLMKQLYKIENWATQHGATMVDFLGRDEWTRLVGKFGYESPGRVFRKELKQ